MGRKSQVAPAELAQRNALDESYKLVKAKILKSRYSKQQTEIQNLRQIIEQIKNENLEVRL